MTKYELHLEINALMTTLIEQHTSLLQLLQIEINALMTTLIEMYNKQSSDWETFLEENEQAMRIAVMGRRLWAKYNSLYYNSR